MFQNFLYLGALPKSTLTLRVPVQNPSTGRHIRNIYYNHSERYRRYFIFGFCCRPVAYSLVLLSLWYGTVRYGTVRYGTVRYGTVQYGTVRYGTVRSRLPDLRFSVTALRPAI